MYGPNLASRMYLGSRTPQFGTEATVPISLFIIYNKDYWVKVRFRVRVRVRVKIEKKKIKESPTLNRSREPPLYDL